ncbi:hypothetical protein [Ralstonia pseudosolanacearum]
MESNFQETSNPYIQFLFAAEPSEFLVDTNVGIGKDIFIALTYPHLIVEVQGQKIEIDCHCPGFHAEPDEYPLFKFLSLYPTFAEQIVTSHQVIQDLFLDYLRSNELWDKLLESSDSQAFLDNESRHIRCIYCLPTGKKRK